jgi:transposase-like protein
VIAQEFKDAIAKCNGFSRHRGRYPAAVKAVGQRYIAAALKAGESTEAISAALGICAKTVKVWSSSSSSSSSAPQKCIVSPSPNMVPVEVASEPAQTAVPRYTVRAPAGLMIECDLVGVVQLIRALT